MPKTHDFKTDLSQGEAFEMLVCDMLNAGTAGHDYDNIGKYFKDYDIHCKLKGMPNHRFCPTIECKFDKMSRTIGNGGTFLFEVPMLRDSKATEFYFGDGHELFIFDRLMLIPLLRDLIAQKKAWIGEYGQVQKTGEYRGRKVPSVKVYRHTLLKVARHKRIKFEVNL